MGEHGAIAWGAVQAAEDRGEHRDRSRSREGTPASGTAGDEEIPVEDRTDYTNILRGLPEPTTPLEILQSCSSLAVGLTTVVATLKSTNERSIELLQDQRASRLELARALEVVAAAIQRQANGIESLVAGVNYNTGRVGAVSGEMVKLRKWIEWIAPKPLEEYYKKNSQLTQEQGEKIAQLFEALTAEVQGLGTGVISELKNLQEVIQGAMTKSSEAEPSGMGIAEPCGIGPGEPCGVGIGESCGIGVISGGPVPAVGFPPPGPPLPPLMSS